ncbi:MAG TPA: hypothetical protein VE422_21740 [Terriglobia bacterium]|nr:hypothetical protein [Terriglobia bacterium]
MAPPYHPSMTKQGLVELFWHQVAMLEEGALAAKRFAEDHQKYFPEEKAKMLQFAESSEEQAKRTRELLKGLEESS